MKLSESFENYKLTVDDQVKEYKDERDKEATRANINAWIARGGWLGFLIAFFLIIF